MTKTVQLFVPAEFSVPYRVETADFILRKLTVRDVEPDYDAVMSSRANLRQIFGPGTEWPADEMTLQENYDDLQRHDDDFEKREGFTYTVVNPAGTLCLGCLYIYPARAEQHDVGVYYWVRDSVKADGMEEKLGDFVRGWLADVWPFERVVFPGRDISWVEWEKLLPPKEEN